MCIPENSDFCLQWLEVETLLGQCAGWGNMTLFAMSGVGHGGYCPRCPEPLVVDLGLSERGRT